MKTTLEKLEDFISHVRQNKISSIYYKLERKTEWLKVEEGQPNIRIIDLCLLSSKTDDDRKLFTYFEVINENTITKEGIVEFNSITEKAYKKFVFDNIMRLFQGTVTNGMVE